MHHTLWTVVVVLVVVVVVVRGPPWWLCSPVVVNHGATPYSPLGHSKWPAAVVKTPGLPPIPRVCVSAPPGLVVGAAAAPHPHNTPEAPNVKRAVEKEDIVEVHDARVVAEQGAVDLHSLKAGVCECLSVVLASPASTATVVEPAPCGILRPVVRVPVPVGVKRVDGGDRASVGSNTSAPDGGKVAASTGRSGGGCG